MDKLTVVELLWKLLPAALVAPFITFGLGRLGSNTDRKLGYRTFIDIDEVRCQYKLENMPNLKSGTKLITTEAFKKVEKKIESMIEEENYDVSEGRFNYLKVKSYGKSIVTSGTISIKMVKEDKTDSWNLDIALPILEPNEEIFIPLDRLEDIGIVSYIENIEIKYRTQSGERMRYKSVRKRNNPNNPKETSITNSYDVKKLNLYYWAIDKNKGRNSSWIFLDNEKDKSKDKKAIKNNNDLTL
ncbi:PHB domain-containing protein [Priestia megaterium]|uniref:hypothetical protein n=1 Tax=Priestia megaterium TaxID=1404 RepID=UPI000BF5BE8F|nr:hypothetical protein [Priestia megaterium]MED4240459.1 hypothetical protein [Priestia megaterium]PFL59882.1 hypothetical protein COJ36_28480 [Priestia megaterium]